MNAIDPKQILSASTKEQKQELFVALTKDLIDLSSPTPVLVTDHKTMETLGYFTPWTRPEPETLTLTDDDPYHQELKRRIANVEAGQSIPLEEFIARLAADDGSKY